MCAPVEDIPSPAPTDNEKDEEEAYGPHYSVGELSEIFLDFYRFLATLHYDPSDLRIPPPGGWDLSGLPPDFMNKKSEHVIELMRHLPYFREAGTHVHYKSKLIDYTDPEQQKSVKNTDGLFLEINNDLKSCDGEIVDHSDILVIAWGYESGGRYLALDALRGEMTEDINKCDLLSPVDIKEFFDNLKEKYRTLQLIPCPGRETQEAEDVEECEEPITKEEVRAQPDEDGEWGTDLDWQWVRQVYRQYGWPDSFRREEAVGTIDEFMDVIDEERGSWEGAFY